MKTVDTIDKKYCPECGAENDLDSLYCQECGAELEASNGANGESGKNPGGKLTAAHGSIGEAVEEARMKIARVAKWTLLAFSALSIISTFLPVAVPRMSLLGLDLEAGPSVNMLSRECHFLGAIVLVCSLLLMVFVLTKIQKGSLIMGIVDSLVSFLVAFFVSDQFRENPDAGLFSWIFSSSMGMGPAVIIMYISAFGVLVFTLIYAVFSWERKSGRKEDTD